MCMHTCTFLYFRCALHSFPSLPGAGSFIISQLLPSWAWDHTEQDSFLLFSIAKSKHCWKWFLVVGMGKKHAKFTVSMSLASWCGWGGWQKKIMWKGTIWDSCDGNDSRKTEVIYLQPAQRLSRAEDENRVSNAESWHAHLWGLRKKRKQRVRWTMNWVWECQEDPGKIREGAKNNLYACMPTSGADQRRNSTARRCVSQSPVLGLTWNP